MINKSNFKFCPEKGIIWNVLMNGDIVRYIFLLRFFNLPKLRSLDLKISKSSLWWWIADQNRLRVTLMREKLRNTFKNIIKLFLLFHTQLLTLPINVYKYFGANLKEPNFGCKSGFPLLSTFCVQNIVTKYISFWLRY